MELKFLNQVTITITHLRKYFEPNTSHISQENPKMVVDDTILFLESCEAFLGEIN